MEGSWSRSTGESSLALFSSFSSTNATINFVSISLQLSVTDDWEQRRSGRRENREEQARESEREVEALRRSRLTAEIYCFCFLSLSSPRVELSILF